VISIPNVSGKCPIVSNAYMDMMGMPDSQGEVCVLSNVVSGGEGSIIVIARSEATKQSLKNILPDIP